MQVPIYLTSLRILLIPIMVVVYLKFPTQPIYTVCVFVIAGLTDWLDGFFARYLSAVTNFGKFLDPVADKMVIVTALMLLVIHANGILMIMAFVIMVQREIFIMALREWLAKLGKAEVMSVSYAGKFKTLVQFIAISIIMLTINESVWLHYAYSATAVATCMSLYSMIKYFIASKPHLTQIQDGV